MNDSFRRHSDSRQDLPTEGSAYLPGFDTDDWNVPVEESSEGAATFLSGKIVARMPDLGQCSSPGRSDLNEESVFYRLSLQARHFTEVGKKKLRDVGDAFVRYCRAEPKAGEEVATPKASVVAIPVIVSPRTTSKGVYTKLIVVGVVLFFCGVLLIARGGKKSDEEQASDRVKPSPSSASTESDLVSSFTPTMAPAAVVPKVAANYVDATEKKSAANPFAEKPVAKPCCPEKELPTTFAAVGTEKSQEKTETSPFAVDKDAFSQVARTEVDPNSPWERAATDHYSPWTMNSSQRRDAALENKAKPAPNTTAVTLAQSPTGAVAAASSPVLPPAPPTPGIAGTIARPAVPTHARATGPQPGANYPPTVYPQGSYPQAASPQNVYPQHAYAQGASPQSGRPQPQGRYPQAGYAQGMPSTVPQGRAMPSNVGVASTTQYAANTPTRYPAVATTGNVPAGYASNMPQGVYSHTAPYGHQFGNHGTVTAGTPIPTAPASIPTSQQYQQTSYQQTTAYPPANYPYYPQPQPAANTANVYPQGNVPAATATGRLY